MRITTETRRWHVASVGVLWSLFFACWGHHAHAQFLTEIYQFPTSVPGKYVVNARADYERMAGEPYKKFRKRDVQRFAELTAYGKREIMRGGGVYYDVPLVEGYLARVLARIAPGVASQVYLARDASYNAFAIHDGSLFMHVGILADMPNEAALAGVMGHEIAHHLNDDNRASFYNKLKLYSRAHRNTDHELRIDKAHEDRVMEHIADSLGIGLARKAGYDLHWTLSTYLLFLDPHLDGDSAIQRSADGDGRADARSNLLDDHPDARQRIEFLNGWLAADSSLRGGEAFLVDRDGFMKVRRMARLEALNVLMESHQYYACIERGFRYHLSEPAEQSYLYFLAEALRRYLYVMPDMGIKGFLAVGYEAHLGNARGILNDLGLLMRDSTLLSTIDTTGYYNAGKPLFESNDEALVFFLDKGHRAGIVELLLSEALQYRKNSVVRDSCLERYIAAGGRAKVFAEAFKNNQLDRRLRKNKGALVLLDEIDFVEDHVYGYRTRYVQGEERAPKYERAVRSMLAKKFPERTVISVADMKRDDLPSFLAYERVTNNLAIVQWMWDYEHDRAVRREQARGNRKRKARTVSQQNTDALDSSAIAVDEPSPPAEDAPDPWKRRKRTKQDMKFYFIDPLYWEFLVEKGYATVEYMKMRAFDDKTKVTNTILGGLFFMYPMYWYVSGAGDRYAFDLHHVKFNT
ncbi:MAG TPA: M48 family metallopeptidase, partial [Flavobacteriales bacterium]|nr:M48 family metallopeptidase [Flavobacteriales bacterium]